MNDKSTTMGNSSPFHLALIDIECTCDTPVQLPRDEIETIEIGGVVVSMTEANIEQIDTLQLFIRPQEHPRLSTFCQQLTGISQQAVDCGFSFSEACTALNTWLQKHDVKAWGSWGNFDQRQLTMECERDGLSTPFGNMVHHNIKQLFARKRKHRVGLGRALSLTGLTFEGRQHSGKDDAINIARLLGADPVLCQYLWNRCKNILK